MYCYDHPACMQNAEALTEYFSSQMTGHNRQDHSDSSEEACDLRDQTAKELPEGFKYTSMIDASRGKGRRYNR